jgi:LPXTG-motif cell wall-anchored protein
MWNHQMPRRHNPKAVLLSGALVAWLGSASWALTLPSVAESSVAESSVAESSVAESSVAESSVAESVVAESVVAQGAAAANAGQFNIARAEAGVGLGSSPGPRRPIRPPRKPPKKSRGSPGPIVGMGLPALLLAGGAYWLLRRRRNRVHEA